MNRKILDKTKLSIQKLYNWFRIFQNRKSAKIKYELFINGYGTLLKPNTSEYRQYWGQLSNKLNSTGYKIYYSLTGRTDIQIVPRELYYSVIEPGLNDYTMAKPWRDKNMFARRYRPDLFPKTILMNMKGTYYDDSYKILRDTVASSILKMLHKDFEKVIIKPTLFSGRGFNVRTINLQNEILSMEFFNEHYGCDFIIQEFIEQHDTLKAFGTIKMNCVRFNTYRSVATEEIFIHDTVLYFNPPIPEERLIYGSNSIAIQGDGSLGSISLNSRGEISKTLPATKRLLSSLGKIPQMETLKLMAIEIAENTPYQRRLGLDMTVDETGRPYVIEVNNGSLGTAQYLNGGLFKQYTDEVIEYCKSNKSKVNFNFTS